MHVTATLVSQTTPLNIDWGCGLRTNEYAHARTYVCAIVVNYCSCVLNKIMPPKGGSERSELTPCTVYSGVCTYRCLDFCYSKINESVCTYEYMAELIIELIGTKSIFVGTCIYIYILP